MPSCERMLPAQLRVAEVTSSSIAFAWRPAPANEASRLVQFFEDGVSVAQSTTHSARISGLKPASVHTIRVAVMCMGSITYGPPVTVTTAAGPAARPAPARTPAVTATDDRSATISWTAAPGAGRYAVYEGAARVATTRWTSVTIRGLYRGNTHRYTVVAEDGEGNQSTGVSTEATTAPCDPRAPRPLLSATALSPSTVSLSWVLDAAASFYTVYDRGTAVATSQRPTAVVSGLPSGSKHRFSVVASLGACGDTASARVGVRTPDGPAARPTAPTTFRFAAGHPVDLYTASVTLTWAQPASTTPVLGYRLYEGGDLVGTSIAPTITQLLPNAVPHRYTVSAVDADGNESPQSEPLNFSVPYFPLP